MHVGGGGLAQQWCVFDPIVELRHFSIVAKAPLNTPKFSAEGMHILQRHGSLCGVSNVGHHVQGVNGVVLDEVGHGRFRSRQGVMKRPETSPFVDAAAKPMRMNVRLSSPLAQASKGESEISFCGTVHPEELTHDGSWMEGGLAG